MLGTVIRFTMYFVDNVQSEAVDQFQHRQLLRSCLELIYTNRINSKWNKNTCTHLSKFCSLFCLKTNKINIKTIVTCEETCSSTLQWLIPDNTLPQKVFSVDWNLSFMYVHELFPLFPPCSAQEIVLTRWVKNCKNIFKRQSSFQFCWDGELLLCWSKVDNGWMK